MTRDMHRGNRLVNYYDTFQSWFKTAPNSAVSPWTLVLQGKHQDNICTGLLGSCPGCPCQGTWWASSRHISGLTIVSEYSRCRCHFVPGTASTSTWPHMKTFWLFSQGFLVFVLPPACLCYANIITQMFSSTIHTDGFGAMCCNFLWLLMFRKGNRALEISLRTTQKEVLLPTLWYQQFDSSYLRDTAMSTEHKPK